MEILRQGKLKLNLKKRSADEPAPAKGNGSGGKPVLHLKKDSPTSSFAELAAEAVEVTRKIIAMSELRSCRLTAEAMLKETLALGMTTAEKVAALRKAVESDKPGLDDSRATLRRMCTWLEGPNWSSPGHDPRRLQFLSTEATRSELALRQSSHIELLCVAISIQREKRPDIFGACQDSDAHAKELAELKQRQGELFEKLNSGWTAADVFWGPMDQQGRAIAFFTLNGCIASPVAPKESAGERLVNFLLSNYVSPQ